MAYAEIERIQAGLLIVKDKGGKYSLMDGEGKILFGPITTKIQYGSGSEGEGGFDDAIWTYQKPGGGWAYLDNQGKEIFKK